MTAKVWGGLRGGEIEQKQKGLMDIDNNVVIAGSTRKLKDNGKNTIM